MIPSAATAPTGAAATLVLGQPNATSEAAAIPPTAASLGSPAGLWVDPAGHLWVADTGNNRILRYDAAASATTGSPAAAADRVLGQQDFDTSSAGSSNQQLSEPIAVTMDAHGTLWVADRANNRVLGYPAAAGISSGTNAARILGQPDFNGGSVSPGTSATQVNGPSGVFADTADNLWVLDQGNNRALRFADISNIENGKPANGVVGQASFGTSVTALDARRLDQPFLGIFVQPQGQLWISDLNHNRVLRFQPVDSEDPVVRIKGKRKFTTAKSSLLVRGTARDDVGVTKVTVQLGRKKAKPARGTTSWKKRVRLIPGRNIIRAVAHDAAGHRSTPARIIVTRTPPLPSP
jgi:sugar lactone lactonase YvrE